MNNSGEQTLLKPRDYASSQEVKWCPGCGDYAIINAVQKALADIQVPKENIAFVSGIGCSSRFPYYMDTYGFHGIHGRAAAIATGVKLAAPDLQVWVITGDGDSLAIGGNHFIHAIRRNANMNMVLFNNRIYGLTKGQYSPTSERGKVTKTSPHGTVEDPFNPAELALGAGATFFARVPDTDVKLMTEVFVQAAAHRGFSLVEVLQNCVIFNDKTHAEVTAKDIKEDRQLILEHGMPMRFGPNKNLGLRLSGLRIEVVEIGVNGISEADLLVHDARDAESPLHMMLARLKLPDFPIAMGVLRNVEASVYDADFHAQIADETAHTKYKNLGEYFLSGQTFEVS
jgi:2-oxoglutarate ferredoxin oxidoreductase subunit beta